MLGLGLDNAMDRTLIPSNSLTSAVNCHQWAGALPIEGECIADALSTGSASSNDGNTILPDPLTNYFKVVLDTSLSLTIAFNPSRYSVSFSLTIYTKLQVSWIIDLMLFWDWRDSWKLML